MEQVSSFEKKKCNVYPELQGKDSSLPTMLNNVNSFGTKLKLFLLNIGKRYYPFSNILEIRIIQKIFVTALYYAFEQL